MDYGKEGIRVLGVSESFRGGASVLCGVVMRGDGEVDGAAFSTATVGGLDATEAVLDLWDSLDRTDIHAVLLNGCVISWFNVVDIEELHEVSGVPVVCVTYEESGGLEGDIERHFEGEEAEVRLERYRGLGDRRVLSLENGHDIYVRPVGIGMEDVGRVLERFTSEGARPEPLRVAGLFARASLVLLEGRD